MDGGKSNQSSHRGPHPDYRPRKLRLGYHKYFENDPNQENFLDEEAQKQPMRRPLLTTERKSNKKQNQQDQLYETKENAIQMLQNTILNEQWEESYSKDMAVLESLLMQDRLDGHIFDEQKNKTYVLETL